MKKVASKEQKNTKPEKKILAQKEKGWVKFVRVLIYAVSIIGVTVGASLIKTGGLSVAYADGTYAAKINNGEIIFFIFLVILCGNIMWGVLRWFLRGYHEKWKPGRTFGKLVGGGIWRTLVIAPLVLFSFLVITPKVIDIIGSVVTGEQRDQKKISLSEPLDNLEYISGHLEDYTLEELEEELAPYFFKNIDFGVDASSNVSKKQSPGFLTQNAVAYTPSVTILNKAKLSSKGNFVVFYTDTGDDTISGEKAGELAEMLENIIVGYEENLGLEYK
ncbi:MAG: hypothetical protein Q4C24_02735, partial [Candidatus Saccharibacteria bacterium]|nr:hypothetical protein [Candidatus Saccharibacteria bacterium]